MKIKTAYNNWSETYDEDSNLTRDLDAEIVRKEFINSRFNSILEVGCGTGKNTTLFSQIGDKIYALDFSEGMISQAREKVQGKNITFIQTDITQTWSIENNSVDLVTCNLILEHIENLEFIFSESNRCLKSGCKLFINELHPFRQYEGKKATFFKNGKSIAIDAFIHNVSDYLNAAKSNGFKLQKLDEHWHVNDKNKLPRILSFFFVKE